MNKPKGGRGHKAPYQVQMVRCPVPIKPEVEAVIARYRDRVAAGGSQLGKSPENAKPEIDVESVLKLVDRFVAEIGQTDSLYERSRRNNVNLARFRDWIASQAKN